LHNTKNDEGGNESFAVANYTLETFVLISTPHLPLPLPLPFPRSSRAQKKKESGFCSRQKKR